MKPPPFDYVAPTSLDDALRARAERADGSTAVLAGGQSLVPALNLRVARPDAVLDLNGVPGLDGIEERDGAVALGALVRQRAAERSPLLTERLPLLREALVHVAHPSIRTRGTVCGSIAHADPAAEMPAIGTLLGAEMILRSVRGERSVPVADLVLGPYMTVIEPDELAVEVVFPLPPAGAGTAFLEVARRHGDFALAGVAALVALDGDRVAEARLAFLGVSWRAVRAPEAEAWVAGRPADEASFAEAARIAAAGLDTRTDLHASAAYRRHLAGTLAGRALRIAAGRARA